MVEVDDAVVFVIVVGCLYYGSKILYQFFQIGWLVILMFY
jgi:hypothetical protein